MKHRSFDSGNHRMLVIQYVCCLPMNSVNTCFMLHLFSKYQRYDKYICSINREIPCIWRSVFRNCLISGNRLSRQQSLLLLFFFLLSLTVLLINFYGHNRNDGYYFYVKYIRDQGHIYTVLILVCLSFCLSFCLWLPANFWAIENVEECQDFIWWIMKKNGRESSRLLIKFKVKLNTKT